MRICCIIIIIIIIILLLSCIDTGSDTDIDENNTCSAVNQLMSELYSKKIYSVTQFLLSIRLLFAVSKTKIRKTVQVWALCERYSVRRCFINRVIAVSLVIFPAGESDDCAMLSPGRSQVSTTSFSAGPPTHNMFWNFFPLFHLGD